MNAAHVDLNRTIGLTLVLAALSASPARAEDPYESYVSSSWMERRMDRLDQELNSYYPKRHDYYMRSMQDAIQRQYLDQAQSRYEQQLRLEEESARRQLFLDDEYIEAPIRRRTVVRSESSEPELRHAERMEMIRLGSEILSKDDMALAKSTLTLPVTLVRGIFGMLLSPFRSPRAVTEPKKDVKK